MHQTCMLLGKFVLSVVVLITLPIDCKTVSTPTPSQPLMPNLAAPNLATLSCSICFHAIHESISCIQYELCYAMEHEP